MPLRIDRGQSLLHNKYPFFFYIYIVLFSSFYFFVGNRSDFWCGLARLLKRLRQCLPSPPPFSLPSLHDPSCSPPVVRSPLFFFFPFPAFAREDIYTGIESNRDGQSGCSCLTLTVVLVVDVDRWLFATTFCSLRRDENPILFFYVSLSFSLSVQGFCLFSFSPRGEWKT